MKLWHYVFLGAVLVLAVYGLYWYRHIRTLKMTGYEMVLNTVPYAQSPENPSARVLVLGDSVALGVGAAIPAESIVGRLGVDNPDMEIVNMGVSGLRTHEIVGMMHQYPDDSFDVVFLHIGGNDVVSRLPVIETERNMRAALIQANRIAPNVLFATHGDFRTVPALPWGLRWIWESRNVQQRELYHRLKEEFDAQLADYYRKPGVIPQERVDVWYAADEFHLSSEGQKDMYEMNVKEKFETFDL